MASIEDVPHLLKAGDLMLSEALLDLALKGACPGHLSAVMPVARRLRLAGVALGGVKLVIARHFGILLLFE